MDLKPGKPVLISEIVNTANQKKWIGETVRIVGILVDYDPKSDTATIDDSEGNMIRVNASLLGVFDYNIGVLYQLIGNLDWESAENTASSKDSGHSCEQSERHSPPDGAGRIILRARIFRDADGLDFQVYQRAVLKLRESLDIFSIPV
ncbi:hypothetical protein H4219_004998 [Mycoemilia scoparia]|uniref:Uncharacterized protein n=1 Tax=Mycoemilia scoparia TaxID=417184 RepID=A0A9W7ZPL5_9FUNG|nr:hypothetical protein H4219_004998 [Mycoemilia scoparia]